MSKETKQFQLPLSFHSELERVKELTGIPYTEQIMRAWNYWAVMNEYKEKEENTDKED